MRTRNILLPRVVTKILPRNLGILKLRNIINNNEEKSDSKQE